MLDHISIRVSHCGRSKQFFSRSLVPLVYQLLFEPHSLNNENGLAHHLALEDIGQRVRRALQRIPSRDA